MNKKSFLAMTSSLVASLALAQGATAATSKKAAAPAAPMEMLSNRTKSRPPAGVSTASISDTAPQGLKRFSFLFMNETQFAPAEGVEQGVNPPLSGLNRFQLGYELAPGKKLTFREDSTFRAPRGQRTEYHLTDPFIAYTDSKFAELPGGWVMTIQPRLLLPFGEASRFQTHSLGGEALALIFDKSVGRMDIEFLALGTYINNTQDYFWNLDAARGVYVSRGVVDWWTLLVAEAVYNFTDKFWIQHDILHFTQSFRANAEGLTSASTILVNETAVGYRLMKQFHLIASVENDVEFSTPSAAQFYQQKNMLYNLYVKLSL